MIETLRKYESDGLVNSQTHPTLPLIIWNYSRKTEYERLWDEVTINTRGLVTDIDGNIVSCGFPKFFNIGEQRHVPSDRFEIFEKLDGQYIAAFFYKGQLVVNSRGSFTSTYAIEARRILELNMKFNWHSNPDWTYIFELIGFEQIVVKYSESDLVLTAIFDRRNIGHEWSPNCHSVQLMNLSVAKQYNGLDWKNIQHLNWKNSEGFVVLFDNGSRCKVKFQDYVTLHRQMTNLSTTGIWEALRQGHKVSELLTDVPDETFDDIRKYENELSNQFNEIVEMSSKYFQFFSPILFDRRLIVERIDRLLINPYKSVVKYMIDGKDHVDYIWRRIKPKFKKL